MDVDVLAIIHTTPATVAPLKELAERLIEGCRVVNFVDDSILPQLAIHSGDLCVVEKRVRQYGKFAEEVGASVLLEACSSIGALVPKLQADLSIPVVRIDREMARAAVSRGPRVSVAATLRTTLEPTMQLLREESERSALSITPREAFVAGAYEKLLAGDAEAHDRLIAETLRQVSEESNVVVLAQASMARVLPGLTDEVREKCLTSPPFAMAEVKRLMRGAT